MHYCAERAISDPVVYGHPSIERRMIVAKLHHGRDPSLKARLRERIQSGWDRNADMKSVQTVCNRRPFLGSKIGLSVVESARFDVIHRPMLYRLSYAHHRWDTSLRHERGDFNVGLPDEGRACPFILSMRVFRARLGD